MLQVKLMLYTVVADTSISTSTKSEVGQLQQRPGKELALMQFMNNVLEVTSIGYRRRLFWICSFAERILSN